MGARLAGLQPRVLQIRLPLPRHRLKLTHQAVLPLLQLDLQDRMAAHRAQALQVRLHQVNPDKDPMLREVVGVVEEEVTDLNQTFVVLQVHILCLARRKTVKLYAKLTYLLLHRQLLQKY